jgi:predicted GTPase
MQIGAGIVAAQKFGASEIVDPRPWTVGTITETYEKYPYIGELIPAMGYSPKQIKDLEKTINAVDADSVVVGTPIDLSRLNIKINKPTTRVKYDLQEIGHPTLNEILIPFVKKNSKPAAKKAVAKKNTKKK